MTTLTITVTKEILEKSKMCGHVNGNPNFGSDCAFALAVRDILPHAHLGKDKCFPFGLYNPDRSLKRSFALPSKVKRFIERFDNTAPASRPSLPVGSFDIELPDWVIKRIDISELKPLLENHPNLKLQTA